MKHEVGKKNALTLLVAGFFTLTYMKECTNMENIRYTGERLNTNKKFRQHYHHIYNFFFIASKQSYASPRLQWVELKYNNARNMDNLSLIKVLNGSRESDTEEI